MTCLTREQLAQLALRFDDDKRPPAHVHVCESCRAGLGEMVQLADRLSTAHAELDRDHEAARARLLASLSGVEMPVQRAGIWNWLALRYGELTMKQRMAVGGVGLSTAMGLLLLAWIVGSAGQLSAMERLAKKLREVKSFSYKLSTQNTYVPEGETQATTVKRNGTHYWLEPSSLSAEDKIVKFAGADPAGKRDGKLLVHMIEVFPDGKPGIFIDHMAKTFNWLPELRVDDIPRYSPLNQLRIVREGSGEVERDLGMKVIQGKTARGYVMVFNDVAPDNGPKSVEVWLDPETDLPLEFSYEVKTPSSQGVFRITDCRWNIELDPKIFETVPPEGYSEKTSPVKEKNSAESQ